MLLSMNFCLGDNIRIYSFLHKKVFFFRKYVATHALDDMFANSSTDTRYFELLKFKTVWIFAAFIIQELRTYYVLRPFYKG